MARYSLGPFTTSKPDIRRPDPTQMGQLLAAPEVARQGAKAQAFQALANLPSNIIESYTKVTDIKRKRAQEDLNNKPTELVSPALAAQFPDLIGVPFSQAKELLPSLASIRKTDAKQADDIVITEEEALKRGKVPTGARVVKPTKSTLPEVTQTNLVKAFNSDPSVRRAQNMSDSASIARDILDSSNPIGDQSIGVFMARASGEVGNLAQQEQAQYGGSKALTARLQRSIERNLTGKLDEEDRQFIKDLATTMETSSLKNLDRIARLRAKQFSKANKSLSENELYSIFHPMGTISDQSKPTQKTGLQLPSGFTVVEE